jgi:hypothetical protein
MGAWILGTLFMTVVATQNFRTIDRLLADAAHPALRAAMDDLGATPTRELLRYLSSELNRLYFLLWNVVQLPLGAAAWVLAGRNAPRRVRAVIGAMVVTVAIMVAWFVPEITTLGRQLDFVPRDPPPPEMGRFWVLHAAYTALELGKLAAAVWVTARLARAARLSPLEV